MLVFATQESLQFLSSMKDWGADGTFKIAPSIFHQVFSIHVQINHLSFPCLFALLPNKKEETYQKLFEWLKQDQPDCSPASMMLDFELASRNAFLKVFPSSVVNSCLFHLGQANYRKLVDLGYKKQYHQDSEFSIAIRCFTALSFLPPDDVIDGFELLSENNTIPDTFIAYFEANYIGIIRGRNGIRRNPIFPINSWNNLRRHQQNLPRTNNNLEGLHNGIQSSITSNHPNLWRLIDALKKENALTELKRIQYLNGETEQKKKYKDINKRIDSILNSYNANDKLLFLKSISYNLHCF